MPDNKASIRKPAVAGMFYPSSPTELTRTIAELYSRVHKTPIDGVPLALIAPHAGYPYSGKTAATAFKLLEGEDFKKVVIVSPSHTVFFRGASVFEGGGYETPLGVVETDRELSEKIAEIHPSVYLSNMGHATGTTRGEHALEVMLPFLQIVLGRDFKLVAIVMGDQEEETVRALGESLGKALADEDCLMIASTDLSHFYNEKKARQLDKSVQEAVAEFDPEYLMKTIASGRGEACGGGPMASIMMAAKRLGAKRVQVLDYSHSGEVTGDMSEVVGYMSAVVLADERPKKRDAALGSTAAKPEKPEGFTEEDKTLLHKIAREAVRAKLDGEEYVPPEEKNLNIRRGAFVTLKIDGQLRGCIGQVGAPREVLTHTIADMAVAAAFGDPRFTPVREDEFDKLEFEISVLTPLEHVKDFNDIEVGRDGLMIKLGAHSGLLLPQVATEYDWDKFTFLEQTCLKAGLPKNSYKDKFAEIYKFSAEIF